MDLFIETLTGTAFELRVSPFETIMNVKAKIQRLEGIPISQQHLIWKYAELEDDCCLHDYDISDGATLQLVLAMRGGPINMKRVPVEDSSLREMAEYVEANRDEIWEKFPKDNKQVTFLVFRDGDQYNVYRVVDRGDGTLTPLSEISGTSLYNLYDDEDEENSVTLPQETVQENNVTMNKMKLLKSKMQSLHMSKKPRGGGGTSVEQVSFQTHSPPPASRIMFQPRSPSKDKHPKYQPHPPSSEKPTASALASRRRLHRASSSFCDHSKFRDSIHSTDPCHPSYSVEASSSNNKPLPPINKTKNSGNIDISEFIPAEDMTIHARTFFNHASHEHGPAPNLRNLSDDLDGNVRHEQCDVLDTRLGHPQKVNKVIPSLKEKKTSVERLRSGLLKDSLSRVHHKTNQVYSTTEVLTSRPPPPPQLASGKKTRCTFCRKKTGLATTYVCRCGNPFCASHRYAETHNCDYDYKTDGRKLLEQSNPLVVAPKLPKI